MFIVEKVSKTYYKKNVKAVDNVSFEVNPGEIFGLVGPNGAGKSTLIKMAVGILKIDEGDIRLDGESIVKDALKAKGKLGYVSDNHQVMERLTGQEYLNFVANIYNLDKNEAQENIKILSERFGLTASLKDMIKTYSHGMKQKLCIIASLIHNPKVWILDEPLTGLDPQSSFELKKCMKEHSEKGNVVVFSSHVLEVVEKLCDRVGIINKGHLLAIGTVEEIKSSMGKFNTFEEAFINLTKEGEKDE